jgi:hypothetical protein
MPNHGRETFECPSCGAEVRVGSRACKECGADDQTGWSEDTMYDGLDLPDPGHGQDDVARPRRSMASLYRIAAILILIGFVLFVLSRFR